MWKFDANDYMKRTLSPAVDAFKANGSLPNMFERYYLPFDVADNKDIEAAVRTVTGFWNKEKSNPRFKQLLPVLLKEGGIDQKDALRFLSDPNWRAAKLAEIEAADKQKAEERFEELRSSIRIVAAKGFITPAEKTALIARFEKAGLSAKEIESYIRVPIREAVTKLPTDKGLPDATRARIRGSLAVLKNEGVIKQQDFYEFLGVGPNASKDQVEKRYQELSAEWERRANNSVKVEAKHLLSLVKTELIPGGIGRYETARIYDIVEKLGLEVRLAATDKIVTAKEFENLVAFGVQRGLSRKLTSEYILTLALEVGAAVEWMVGEETVRCENCSAAVPAKEEKCVSCGADLWTVCPSCKKRQALSEAACGHCGFVIANQPKMRLLVRQAQLALEDGAISEALKHAREAERLWGRRDEVAAVLSLIDTRRKSIEAIFRRLDDALTAKKLRTAQSALAELSRAAPDYVGPDGKSVAQIKGEIDDKVSRLAAVLQRAREHEKSRRPDDAVLAFLEAQGIAADSEDAANGLLRNAPAPPSSTRVSVHQEHVLVEWPLSPAVGNLEYLVVRREHRAPAAPDDGEIIARTKSLSCRDSTARPGSHSFYAVFAERGGTTSRTAASAGLLIAREVRNFKLEAADGVVRGSWDFDITAGRVHVFCREGSAPERNNGRELNLDGPHNFSDAKLQNGHLYYYRALVEYRDARGHSVFTPGMVQSARPDQPPKAVEHMVITFEEGGLNLVWKPPAHGRVNVYRTDQEPAAKSGSRIPLSGIAGLGTRLQNKSDGQAVDLFPPENPTYYVPVTIAGDVAVIGKSRRFVALPDVSHTVVEDFGHYLQLRWQWPESCQSVMVAWRSDTFPQDAQDSQATTRRVSRGEYENQGCFRVESSARMAFHFVVFAALEAAGETVYSGGVRPGARAQARLSQPVAISYTLARGRVRRSRFTLMLTAEQPVSRLPELVVIAKPGDLQPLRSDDGAIVARFSNVCIGAGERIPFEFELNGIQSPLYLRTFFREASSYQLFRLLDPPGEQLKIR